MALFQQAAEGGLPLLVDVAIDQGGSIATIDRITTHADPYFVKHGVKVGKSRFIVCKAHGAVTVFKNFFNRGF